MMNDIFGYSITLRVLYYQLTEKGQLSESPQVDLGRQSQGFSMVSIAYHIGFGGSGDSRMPYGFITNQFVRPYGRVYFVLWSK